MSVSVPVFSSEDRVVLSDGPHQSGSHWHFMAKRTLDVVVASVLSLFVLLPLPTLCAVDLRRFSFRPRCRPSSARLTGAIV